MTPIVFSTDDNYVMPTAVAIKSMLTNTDLKEIEIYILYKESLSDQSKSILEEVIRCEGKNVNLQYLDVTPFVSRAESHIGHISGATYYRLALPELLPEYKQCLYLDGDIVVVGNIKDLLQISLPESILIGGVKALSPIFYKKKDKDIVLQELQIPDLNQYVNAGILLINLEEMRKSDLSSKMISMIPKGYSVQDQDIINIVCYNRIAFLNPQFNAMPDFFEYSEKILKEVYGVDEIKTAQKSPCIIHFADKYKPWKYSELQNGDIWYTTYQSIFSDSLQRKVLSRTEKLSRRIKKIKRLIYMQINGD